MDGIIAIVISLLLCATVTNSIQNITMNYYLRQHVTERHTYKKSYDDWQPPSNSYGKPYDHKSQENNGGWWPPSNSYDKPYDHKSQENNGGWWPPSNSYDKPYDHKSQENIGEWRPPKERGKVTYIMDLNGKIRQYFAFETVSINSDVSVICSPHSALMPLGVLIFGVQEAKTEKELLKATGASDENNAGHDMKKLRKKLKDMSGPKIHDANRIYVNKRNTLKTSFVKKAEDVFGSCVESLDMDNGVEAAHKINDWVEKHTDHKIKNILSRTDISPDVSIMIVNSLYFEGLWKNKFNRAHPSTFYGHSGQVTVNMMQKEQNLLYGSSYALGAQAVLIPYQGEAASMLVLLPNARDGLSLLLKQLQLAPDLINGIKMQDTRVNVYLPKFKIETTLDLKQLYSKVGLTEIFTRGMDKMVKEQNIVVSKAVQKAIIEVNEQGTIAAAASVIQGVAAGKPVPSVPFVADHPFLFFIIVHKQQLFAGTFVG